MIDIIPRIFFIFSYLFILGISITFIIKYYVFTSDNEYIWFCSKILTVKNMVKYNNNNLRLFYGYNEDGEKLFLTQPKNYIEFLKFINKDGSCKTGYRQCGILDTYGNKLCFDNRYTCPINDIIIDSSSKLNEYTLSDYDYYIYGNTGEYLYFKIGTLNKGVIAYWYIQDSWPRYINDNNFIFDTDAFNQIFNKTSKIKNDDDDDEVDEISQKVVKGTIDFAGDLIENAAKLAKIQKLITYIDKKLYEDEDNIDKNVTKIYDNQYVKNYFGFEDEESINNFNKIDFRLYKIMFPNPTIVYLSISYVLIYLAFIIINIVIICKIKKDSYNCLSDKCDCFFNLISIILYSVSFFWFFIYTIYIYCTVSNNESFEIAKSIRADKFMEDFLKDFVKPFEKNTLMICTIIILSFSALLFILGWIFKKIYNCIEERKSQAEYQRRILYSNQYWTQNTIPPQCERQVQINNKQNSDRQVINENKTNANQQTDNVIINVEPINNNEQLEN